MEKLKKSKIVAQWASCIYLFFIVVYENGKIKLCTFFLLNKIKVTWDHVAY
jgi:hypothetical protein